jgi:UDPglucose 6-dehydrogenase
VGLVTGACLASLGHQLTCLDVDPAKVAQLQAGKVPIYEPGLDALVAEQIAAGRLTFTSDYAETVPTAETVFICVGTPSMASGQADMSYVESAALSIGEHLGAAYTVIINKSTVPIGSGDWVGMLVRQGAARRPAEAHPVSFEVVSNPEFLREGSALADAFNPDRIVIGAESEDAIERMRALYAPLLRENSQRGREVPFVVTDRASAEMVKYAANAFLATKISFINEIANICERVGADVREVSRGIGMDARIGNAFLSAGIGWGGSCFLKDISSLIHTAREYDCPSRLLDSTVEVNNQQRLIPVRKLQERLKLIKGKTIAVWGLAFKPGTDDLRDAPALTLISRLAELGAELRAHDPQAMEAARRLGVKAELCADPYVAATDADALLLVTEWAEFRSADWQRVKSVMRRPLIVDGRNALDGELLRALGFDYSAVGR